MSDEDELRTLRFVCNVIVSGSGESLGLFRCDEETSLGYIRHCVKQNLEDMKEGERRKVSSFHLLRDDRICLNDYLKMHEVSKSMESLDCVLTVVII